MVEISKHELNKIDSLETDEFWNTELNRENRIHRIHAYPAKFPAFITTKALEFANSKRLKVNRIGDIFCGCGTVAYEAKRNNISFWGCDINPVATLIARTKSSDYDENKLLFYLDKVMDLYDNKLKEKFDYKFNERIEYWYDDKHYKELFALKSSIIDIIPDNSNYILFFLCAFSNILKSTSFWLTKSIKPQYDPNKIPGDVKESYLIQFNSMVKANRENSGSNISSIITGNILDHSIVPPTVDMIITSPPYVTSYEYADLHQLSSLWLGYTSDYREFRKGSIGSLYHVYDFESEMKQLNETGNMIISKIIKEDKSKARAIAKYYIDMQQVINKSKEMLSQGGMALFVIGNTEYKNVKIDNARHLAESILNSGFKKLFATKRKVKQKTLTPYRDDLGRFSKYSSRKVYGEEVILIGQM